MESPQRVVEQGTGNSEDAERDAEATDPDQERSHQNWK
jgi:hypothetical protein